MKKITTTGAIQTSGVFYLLAITYWRFTYWRILPTGSFKPQRLSFLRKTFSMQRRWKKVDEIDALGKYDKTILDTQFESTNIK